MKKILSLALVLPLVISLFSCQILPGTGTPDDPDNPAHPAKDDTEIPKEKDEAGTAVAFVTVDINPSIEITLDENGVVASVYGANEDGQILLYGEAEAKKYVEDARAALKNQESAN
jgi:hypothetical protein